MNQMHEEELWNKLK